MTDTQMVAGPDETVLVPANARRRLEIGQRTILDLDICLRDRLIPDPDGILYRARVKGITVTDWIYPVCEIDPGTLFDQPWLDCPELVGRAVRVLRNRLDRRYRIFDFRIRSYTRLLRAECFIEESPGQLK